MDRTFEKLMRAEEKHYGITPGFREYKLTPFGGIDQQSSRQEMKDSDFYWLENLMRTGEGKLRALWDAGTPIYTETLGRKIIYFYFFVINTTEYVAIFFNDGAAISINLDTGVKFTISSQVNTFYFNGGSLPVCAQWGNQYLLIANNNSANSYWVWDGTLLYSAGGVAPNITLLSGGNGYVSPPTVTAYGGSGSLASFQATVVNGHVTGVQVTSTGIQYNPGDVVQLAFSGGGGNNSAILQAVLTTGTINSLLLLNGGTGYSGTITVSITGGGGTGATATAVQTGGVITGVTLTNPGSGYTSNPTVTVNGSGGGSGAHVDTVLNPGSLSSISIINGGTGFINPPLLTITGGGGTGATANANISGGIITSVNVTAQGSGYTGVPAVIVQTGQNNAAAAAILNLMPYGVSGNAMETYLSRVWLESPRQLGVVSTKGVFSVSAPGSFTDFATSDGGYVFTSSDSFLKTQFTNIRQNNGYLYVLGDSSASVVSNVQTSGNPVTTSFNYQNTDQQTGTSWRDTLQSYSRALIFANVFGVFGLYGGAVTKISGKVDEIFNNAVFPPDPKAVMPSAAVANIQNQKAYLLLITVQDPFSLQYRNVLLGYNESDFFIYSPSTALTFIGTQAVNSNLTAYGTDGNTLFPLFNKPAAITKKLSSKLYGQDNFLVQKLSQGVYVQVDDFSGNGFSISSLNIDTEHGSYPVPQIPGFPNVASTYYPVASIGSGDIYGVNLGITFQSSSYDFAITYMSIGYIDTGSIAQGSDLIAGAIETE